MLWEVYQIDMNVAERPLRTKQNNIQTTKPRLLAVEMIDAGSISSSARAHEETATHGSKS